MAIPFKRENTIVLFNEFRNIVQTTIIASGAIAIIEGGILIAAFIILGIRGAFLWGTIAGILSFLPIVGAPLIWIPATVVQLLQQDYTAATGIFVVGALLNIATIVSSGLLSRRKWERFTLSSLYWASL